MSQTLNIPVALVEEFLKKYFDKYKGMKSYHTIIPEHARQKHFIKNPMGRIKRFKGMWDKHQHNQALNFIPQSTTQEIVSRACTLRHDVMACTN